MYYTGVEDHPNAPPPWRTGPRWREIMRLVGAMRRAKHQLNRFDYSGIAMEPGPDPAHPREWTREQKQILRDLWSAFNEVLAAYDALHDPPRWS